MQRYDQMLQKSKHPLLAGYTHCLPLLEIGYTRHQSHQGNVSLTKSLKQIIQHIMGR
jgi:hypothetical protein